jgi:hypothetical protein
MTFARPACCAGDGRARDIRRGRDWQGQRGRDAGLPDRHDDFAPAMAAAHAP